MKDFIIKLKNAIDGETCLDNETLPFVFLVDFIQAFKWFFIIIFIFLAFITVPIWGLPYSIYSVLKNKRGEKNNETL